MDRISLYRLLTMITVIVVILAGCIVVLTPFIAALLLAVILCLSTWPAFEWLEDRTGGRRSVAALLMTILLAMCFLVPLLFLGSSLADNFASIYKVFLDSLETEKGAPPPWLHQLPVIGLYLENLWVQNVSESSPLSEALSGYTGPVSQWLISAGASIGRGVIDLSLAVLIAFFFFRDGVSLAARVRSLIGKFAGPRGQRLLSVSNKTMVAVVYGILGAALAQGTLAGIGLWIAGVPGATLLGLLTFILSFVPIGPPLIWGPAAIWLLSQNMITEGVFMIVWGLLVVSSIDNLIKPYFIARGSALPLLLVLLGVFGGIIAFGFIGLFIGPTLLALAYTIATEWEPRSDLKPVAPEAKL